MKFRIKVIKYHSGEKKYIVQEKVPLSYRCITMLVLLCLTIVGLLILLKSISEGDKLNPYKDLRSRHTFTDLNQAKKRIEERKQAYNRQQKIIENTMRILKIQKIQKTSYIKI